MFGKLKDYVVKKVLLQYVIGAIDKALASLPANERKTIVGFMIAIIGIILSTLPETAFIGQPILDYLKTLPSTEIIAGGILYSLVGLVHKVVKWVKGRWIEPKPLSPTLVSARVIQPGEVNPDLEKSLEAAILSSSPDPREKVVLVGVKESPKDEA